MPRNDSPRPGDASTSQREYGLDWLRVCAFGLLILYHSGMAYVSWPWTINDPQHSQALETVMLFFNRWRLPLIFLISGAGVAFSLRRRSLGQFAGERLRRLLIPFVFAMLVTLPPQSYIVWRTHGSNLSYIEFYPQLFRYGPHPHHMWFVAYILVYSLVGIPLFTALRSDAGRRLLDTLVNRLEQWPPLLYLLSVPAICVGLFLEPRWPVTLTLFNDWANFCHGLIYFLLGFLIASERRFLDLVTRRRLELLLVGLACATAYYAAIGTRFTDGWPAAARALFGAAVGGVYLPTGLLTLGMVLAVLGFARAHVHRGGPWLSYANEAVYPFYIIHQTITVAVVYAMLPLTIGVWPKFAVAATATFVGSWLVFEGVRRVRLLRPLFGLKKLRAK
ncbi:acyltransferase [Opitutus terrae]|uniref:Acyltransferase family protein n=1 Tax=Opitutus terrae (strain DSM 11246 / JCM 15787 / PB90-1) TaxID=452637 RepID=B1ZUK2_OPITP|nr:acyltransferase family protein [Opitutus terrae]ACB74045.1 acyltransferase family protein [Opitutus terrae PB90-1]